ncbi:MAG: hypothetical protein RR968_00475 [Vagococcus sp.]
MRFLGKIIKYVSLLLWSAIILFPLGMLFFGSFMSLDEFSASQGLRLPESFLYLDNYVTAIKEGNIVKSFAVTFLIILISFPSYFFVVGIRNRSKRLIYLLLGFILSVPSILLVSNEIGYRLLQKDLMIASIQLFEKNYGIPQEEVIIIEQMASYAKHNMTMEITTKKDFANWQEKVAQNSQLLSGEKLTTKALLMMLNSAK